MLFIHLFWFKLPSLYGLLAVSWTIFLDLLDYLESPDHDFWIETLLKSFSSYSLSPWQQQTNPHGYKHLWLGITAVYWYYTVSNFSTQFIQRYLSLYYLWDEIIHGNVTSQSTRLICGKAGLTGFFFFYMIVRSALLFQVSLWISQKCAWFNNLISKAKCIMSQ